MLAFPAHWLRPGVLCMALCGATFATFATFTTFATAAQPAAPGRRPDPLDAGAAVPAVRYESVLNRSTRGPAEDRSIPWREANDTAARIGGWRTYAREAQQAEGAPPAPGAATAPGAAAPPGAGVSRPGPGGHAGHKTP